MWAYVLRRLLYNVPVYLGILLLVMTLLRVNDPVYAYLGKSPSVEQYNALKQGMGLDKPFLINWDGGRPWRLATGFFDTQFGEFLARLARLDFSQDSWEQKRPVGEMIRNSIGPSLSITLPTLFITAAISISIGLVSAFTRGRAMDRTLMILAVVGMSISILVFIIMGQYFGAFWLSEKLGVQLFAISGYEPWLRWGGAEVAGVPVPFPERMNPAVWAHFCLLPVAIGVVVAMGYDTRFYRAVMVEECNRDYITTARAKGATQPKIMFVHMLKNAMIPIITRIMITLPFLIVGSILIETFFNIPGMGRTLISAIISKDFPVIQAFTALFAAVVILSMIATDVAYAIVDPRVRLQ